MYQIAIDQRKAESHPLIFWGTAALVLLTGLVLRLWDLGEASLWSDEVLTEYRAQAPLRNAFGSLFAAGNQGPIYYMLLRMFPTFTELQLRLPGALLGLVGIGTMMTLILRMFNSREIALWAGALISVNPYHVLLSRTARAYSLVFLLSLIVIYFFFELFRGNRTRENWVAFTVSSMLAYLTHYSMGVLVLAQAALMYLFKLPKQWRSWFRAQVLATVPFVFWVVVLLLQDFETTPGWSPKPHLTDLPVTFWNMVVGYTGSFNLYFVPGLIASTVCLGTGVVYTVRRRGAETVYSLLLIVLSLVPVVMISLLITGVYIDRYFMVFLPAVIGLVLYGSQWLPYSRLLLSVILLTGLMTTISAFTSGDYERENWRDVAVYINRHFEPGDGVLVERESMHMALARYGLRGEVLRLYESDSLAEFEGRHRRIWAVYRNINENVHRQGAMPPFDPFKSTFSLMSGWSIANQDYVTQVVTFNGVVVFLVER